MMAYKAWMHIKVSGVSHRVVVSTLPIHTLWFVRGRFVGNYDSTCQVTIIMLSLVHAPHHMSIPVTRVALYGTPVKTLCNGDVIIE